MKEFNTDLVGPFFNVSPGSVYTVTDPDGNESLVRMVRHSVSPDGVLEFFEGADIHPALLAGEEILVEYVKEPGSVRVYTAKKSGKLVSKGYKGSPGKNGRNSTATLSNDPRRVFTANFAAYPEEMLDAVSAGEAADMRKKEQEDIRKVFMYMAINKHSLDKHEANDAMLRAMIEQEWIKHPVLMPGHLRK